MPLVIYLAKRDDSEFAGDQAKEALNFQLTLFLLHVAIWVFVLATLGLGLLVVWPSAIALWLGELVLGVVAALRLRRHEVPVPVHAADDQVAGAPLGAAGVRSRERPGRVSRGRVAPMRSYRPIAIQFTRVLLVKSMMVKEEPD